MSKLISHTTTETLPSGTTITTLHLTPEAKRGLSTNGATIQKIEARLTELEELYPDPLPPARVIRRRWWWPWRNTERGDIP